MLFAVDFVDAYDGMQSEIWIRSPDLRIGRSLIFVVQEVWIWIVICLVCPLSPPC